MIVTIASPCANMEEKRNKTQQHLQCTRAVFKLWIQQISSIQCWCTTCMMWKYFQKPILKGGWKQIMEYVDHILLLDTIVCLFKWFEIVYYVHHTIGQYKMWFMCTSQTQRSNTADSKHQSYHQCKISQQDELQLWQWLA